MSLLWGGLLFGNTNSPIGSWKQNLWVLYVLAFPVPRRGGGDLFADILLCIVLWAAGCRVSIYL
jgi:hypothetical protein